MKHKGIALLFIRLISLFPTRADEFRSKAKFYIDDAISKETNRANRKFTFLCGAPGPLSIGATIEIDEKRRQNLIEQ